jgi:phage terminase large subunit
MNAPLRIRNQFSAKSMPLFKPAPYKVMWGGRGGAKSWDFARALLTLGMNRKLFILCARDIQKSIKESVHKLLSDQIQAMGYGGYYQVLDNEIRGAPDENGHRTRFVFEGLRNNILNIKSMEAIDVCWVTEAEPIPEATWEVLIPTIRRDPPFGPFGQGSEIWIDFNPELASSYTYQHWVLNPPAGTEVIHCNAEDNPWFPEILRRQSEEMLKDDPDSWRTIWGGKVRRTVKGSIYFRELDAAILEERISSKVGYVRGKPVIVTVDLGKSDMTSLCFWQQFGTQHHCVHHYSNSGRDWPHYLEYIQATKFQIGGLWLPHDARQDKMNITATPFRQSLEAYPQEGIVRCEKSAVANVSIRINATRTLFPRIYISEEGCPNLLTSLPRYKYGINVQTRVRTTTPVHDDASHDADSFGSYATWLGGYVEDFDAVEQDEDTHDHYGGENQQLGWMR